MNSTLAQPFNPPYEVDDCIEFKRFALSGPTDTEYVLSKGKIIDASDEDLLEVEIYNPTNNNSKIRDTCWINPVSIINYYPKSIIPCLSVRLVLKDAWKDLIFREVKTVKTKEQSSVTYQYVNDDGFVRSMKYDTIEEALEKVPSEYHSNIKIHYWDYFGFTTHRSIRNNDIHCHREVFFSKKCYGELNLNNSIITGGFYPRRGFNDVPPQKKQYVCGLVEAGEKGLFYRKWFTCSEEFLVLWTMVCEPEHYSLKNNIKGCYKTKSFDAIMKELDTSHYDITKTDIPIAEKKKRYRVYNVENNAIHLNNIYQRIAKKLFKVTKRNEDSLYSTYEERFETDMVWMKKFTNMS